MQHDRAITPLLAGVLCLAASAASAQLKPQASKQADQTAASPAKPSNEATTVPNGQSGAIVVRDQTTGALRVPNDEEARAMAKSIEPLFNTSSEGLVEEALPNGGFKMDLQGRFQSATIARRNSDGTLSWKCVDSASQATEFLMGSNPPSTSGAPVK